MAATPRRAARAEAALRGSRWDHDAAGAASAALEDDFQPLSDLRASADYRLRVAKNLLQRFWLESRTDSPLLAAQVSVYATA